MARRIHRAGKSHRRSDRASTRTYTLSGSTEDSGPGIDPENVERIFHPFFTTKSQGMGMGLSICRSIIEAHNGYLSARSTIDRGSIFQISLPAGDILGAD